MRQRMWENYYKYSSSSEFRDAWTLFLGNAIGFKSCPIFYQFVTKCIMDSVIKEEFPIASRAMQNTQSESLGYEEVNALRWLCFSGGSKNFRRGVL